MASQPRLPGRPVLMAQQIAQQSRVLPPGLHRLPEDALMVIFSELPLHSIAHCVAACHSLWNFRETAAKWRAQLIGCDLPPPPMRLGLHQKLSAHRSFVYHTESALHALHTLETTVECIVVLRGSRYTDLQYHVPYESSSGTILHHSAWNESSLRSSHGTARDGQVVRGHWIEVDGTAFLNLGPGKAPRAVKRDGERPSGVDKLLRAKCACPLSACASSSMHVGLPSADHLLLRFVLLQGLWSAIRLPRSSREGARRSLLLSPDRCDERNDRARPNCSRVSQAIKGSMTSMCSMEQHGPRSCELREEILATMAERRALRPWQHEEG